MKRRTFLQSIAACVAAVGAYRVGKAAPIGTEPKAPPAPPPPRYLRNSCVLLRGHTTLEAGAVVLCSVQGSHDGKTWYDLSPTTMEGGK